MKYKAGKLNADGVFRVWITGKQVFRIVGNCAGVLEETIQDLSQNPSWKGIEITVQDGGFMGYYYYTKEQTLNMRVWRNTDSANWGTQRLFPLKPVYKKEIK